MTFLGILKATTPFPQWDQISRPHLYVQQLVTHKDHKTLHEKPQQAENQTAKPQHEAECNGLGLKALGKELEDTGRAWRDGHHKAFMQGVQDHPRVRAETGELRA